MGKKNFQSITLLFLLISMLVAPGYSLDTGSVKGGFNEAGIPIDISIKLWGFGNLAAEIVSSFQANLPPHMITESYFPSEGKIDQYFLSVDNFLFGIKNRINYHYQTMDNNTMDQLIDVIKYYDNSNLKGGISGTYYNGTDFVTQTGFVIEMEDFGNELAYYNEESGYTLHLLDLSLVNELPTNDNSTHWYRLGKMETFPEISDIRNVGQVREKGLFYDPSASAPLFDTNYFSSSNTSEVTETLGQRVTDLVENVFVGTPYAFNYNWLDKQIQLDLIIYGWENAIEDIREEVDPSFNETDNYIRSVSGLLPYMEVKARTILIYKNQISNTKIDNYISGLEKSNSNSSEPYIKITTNVAERFKSLIRTDYHDKWPSGFYFSLFVFADSSVRNIIWDTDKGEKEYTHGQVGFGVVNLKDWLRLNANDRSKVSLRQKIIQGFGNVIGIPALNNLFASQVESAMSSYGVTKGWNTQYNRFEMDSMARRIGAYYNNSAIHTLRTFRNDLKDGFFRWMNRQPLDDAELKLRLGNIEFFKENYTGAAALYQEGYFDWIDAKEDITQKQGAFFNSIQLGFIIIALLYLISTLKLFTLTKDELYEKLNLEE